MDIFQKHLLIQRRIICKDSALIYDYKLYATEKQLNKNV